MVPFDAPSQAADLRRLDKRFSHKQLVLVAAPVSTGANLFLGHNLDFSIKYLMAN